MGKQDLCQPLISLPSSLLPGYVGPASLNAPSVQGMKEGERPSPSQPWLVHELSESVTLSA